MLKMPRVERFMENVRSEFETLRIYWHCGLRVASCGLESRKRRMENGKKLVTENTEKLII